MLDYLDTIRRKPERARRKILMLSTVISFGLVVVLWVSMGGIGFLPNSTPDAQQASVKNASPFSNIKALVGESTEGILNSFDAFRGAVSYERE